jgi:hypothetical protein
VYLDGNSRGVGGVADQPDCASVRVGAKVDQPAHGRHRQGSHAQRTGLQSADEGVVLKAPPRVEADQCVDFGMGKQRVGELGRWCAVLIHSAAPGRDDDVSGINHNGPNRNTASAKRLPRQLQAQALCGLNEGMPTDQGCNRTSGAPKGTRTTNNRSVRFELIQNCQVVLIHLT